MDIIGSYERSLNHRLLYTIVAATFGVLVFTISALPHETIERSFYPDINALFDAMNHFIGFTIFNFLLVSTFRSWRNGRTCTGSFSNTDGKGGLPPGIWAVYAIAGAAWGLACEASQLLVPSRSFQGVDVAANTLPVLLVFSVTRCVVRRRHVQ